ncbi:MAG: hypothetical protein RLZZ455_1072 [Candidatus Parcubacteria bacterium]|jgi:2-polyprenyl-3-methyl-5-hydroxy-6-metoxy-1,4-benzoquinol methylase
MATTKSILPRFTNIPCPLCGSTVHKILYRSTLTKKDFDPRAIQNNLKNSLDDYTKHGQIVRCKNCSVVYVNPVESISSLLTGYKDVVDHEYLETESYRKQLLKEHLSKIDELSKKGILLDIGCFAGYFLQIAREDGWLPFGIEPSRWAVKYAKKNGARILGSSLYNTKLASNTYDAVTLWDVIEHLDTPHTALKIIHRSLKKDGIIALGTPNIDSLFSRILGEKCPFLIRMHLILYSPKTLRLLLEKNGFEVMSCGSYGRIFPLSYLLDRIQTTNKIFRYFRKQIQSISFLASFPIRINLGDSFIMIAKKI